MPHDEAFRHLALLPHPTITEMGRRVTELHPDGHRFVPFLDVTLHNLACQSRIQTRSDVLKPLSETRWPDF